MENSKSAAYPWIKTESPMSGPSSPRWKLSQKVVRRRLAGQLWHSPVLVCLRLLRRVCWQTCLIPINFRWKISFKPHWWAAICVRFVEMLELKNSHVRGVRPVPLEYRCNLWRSLSCQTQHLPSFFIGDHVTSFSSLFTLQSYLQANEMVVNEVVVTECYNVHENDKEVNISVQTDCAILLLLFPSDNWQRLEQITTEDNNQPHCQCIFVMGISWNGD